MTDKQYIFKGSIWYALAIIMRYFLVSLLPFVKTLFNSPHNIADWSNATWQSLAILIGVIVLSIAIAKSFKLAVTVENGKISQLRAERGIIIKAQIDYPAKGESCILLRQDMLTLIGGTVAVKIIPNRQNDKAAFDVRLSNKDAEKLNRLIGGKTKIKAVNRVRITDVLLHAVISSNAIGEILVIIPTVRYIGKLFGQNAANKIYSALDNLAQRLLYFVPYALTTVIFIVIIGWVVSFLRIFTANCNMILTEHDGTYIRQGLIFKRKINIPLGAKVGKSIKFTPLGWLLNSYDVFMLLPNIERDRRGRYIGMKRGRGTALQCFIRHGKVFYPKKRMWYKFIMWPFYALAILTAVLLPMHNEYNSITLILQPILILALYWLLIEIINFKMSYFKIENGFFKAVCRKGLSVIYVCIPISKASVTITQSIFQRRDGSCNLKIILPYKYNIFKIYNLDYRKLSTFSTGFSTSSNI